MNEVKKTLAERKKEIELYMEHLSIIVQNRNEDTLIKIMKANCFLMLYNLIEAIISNSIEAIRHAIHVNQHEFDHLKDNIKIQIIKDLKKNISAPNFVEKTKIISNDIIKYSFCKKTISDGNIDLKTINELADTYGFEVKGSDREETGHGNSITDIKGKRNDLAHGNFSFSEIGKDYSLQDIEKISKQTIAYLNFITETINTYIQNQQYKISKP